MAKIKMRYLGGGWVHNIPSRDLTEDEVKRYGKERLLASGLYEEVSKPKKTKITYEDEVDLLSDELEVIEETFEED
jgi:hypothetical protein